MAKARLVLPTYLNFKVSGKSCYTMYLQLKTHFSGKRDIIKYNWKMELSDSTYMKRKDRMFFERLAKKFGQKELFFILIGNLVANQDSWVGDISEANPIEFYHQYIAKLKNLDTRFEDDIKSLYFLSRKINVPIDELFEYNSSTNSSVIFQCIQRNIISFETFIMLDSFLDIINKHDCYDNILWQSYSTRLKAYQKLFKVDVEYYQNAYKKVLDNIRY